MQTSNKIVKMNNTKRQFNNVDQDSQQTSRETKKRMMKQGRKMARQAKKDWALMEC